jgi:monoamine oxidase
VLVLEARDRIGGRVLSFRSPHLDLPVELGAEFVHGLAPHTLALASELCLPVVDVPDAHYLLERGRLVRKDDWLEEVEDAAQVLSRRGADEPVAVRLARLRSKERRRLVRDFVCGFDAIDPEVASSVAVAATIPHGDAHRQLRLVTGYGPMIAGLAREAEVRLGHVVREIAWKRGHVRVTSEHGLRHEHHEARAILVTVPVGVLRAPASAPGALALAPDVPALRASLAKLAMGQVVRLALHLDAPLGELVGRPDASMVHTFRPDFPVWWSPAPMRTPVAAAWVGGPPATAIDEESREHIVARARAALRAMGVRRPRILGAWAHDWRHDPFAGGAYAYPLVGGARAGAQLSRPVERTLFFAGEATSEKYAGTVEGALETGVEAARATLRALA